MEELSLQELFMIEVDLLKDTIDYQKIKADRKTFAKALKARNGIRMAREKMRSFPEYTTAEHLTFLLQKFNAFCSDRGTCNECSLNSISYICALEEGEQLPEVPEEFRAKAVAYVEQHERAYKWAERLLRPFKRQSQKRIERLAAELYEEYYKSHPELPYEFCMVGQPDYPKGFDYTMFKPTEEMPVHQKTLLETAYRRLIRLYAYKMEAQSENPK